MQDRKKRMQRKNSYVSVEDRRSVSVEKDSSSRNKKRKSSSRHNKVEAKKTLDPL